MSTGASTSLLDRALSRVGVEPRMYRALVRTYLLLDLRNQQFGRATSTAGAKEILTPLFAVTGQNLLIGLFCSVALFARVDAWFFAMVCLTVSMIVTASSVVVEFNEIVMDPDDLNIIGHQPVPNRTYAAARVTNLMMYVLLSVTSLNFCPAIVGMGLRDSGPEFLLWYWGAALAGGLFAAGLVVLLFNLVAGTSPSVQTRELLAFVQVGAMLIFGYGAQMVIRDPRQSLQMIAYEVPTWIHSTPFGWLADIAAGASAWPVAQRVVHLSLAGLGALGIWVAAIQRLSISYSQMEPGRTAWASGTMKALPAPGQLLGSFLQFFTRPGTHRTAFWLAWTFLRRDPSLRMRCWTTQAVAVAVILMGMLTGKLVDPFVDHGKDAMLTLACLYLPPMALPQILYQLNFSKDHQASWILILAPIDDRVAFVTGLARAMTLQFIIPLLVALFIVLSWQWKNVAHAFACTLASAIAVAGILWASCAGVLRRVPFSDPLSRGESFGPIAMFAGIAGSVLTGLGFCHFALLQIPSGFWIQLALLVLAAGITRVLSFKFIAKTPWSKVLA
ncbi:MAG: hypothetical protein U0996_07125 [Planctomycetaceae bacterium]